MKMRCDRDRLVDLHYGLQDSAEEKATLGHIAGCAGCAAELETIRALMGALRAGEAFPREAEVDWDGFARVTVARAMAAPESAQEGLWNRLVASLTRPMTVSFNPVAAAAMTVVLLVGAGYLGYRFMPAGVPQGESPRPQMTVLLVPEESLNQLTVNLARDNTARYLDETKAVLLTLMDVPIGCDDENVDITAERERAMELLRRQRLVATELDRFPLMRAQEVTTDLQQILLEISSLADCTKDENIQTLRDVIEKRQILVRMELLKQELKRTGAMHV